MSTRERDRRAVRDDGGIARERGAREESDDATAYERRDDGDGDGDGDEAAEAGEGSARAWTRGGGRTMVGRFRD